jgi:hypothetical protein
MRRSFLKSPKRPLAAGALCLGLALMGGEGAVMAAALWAPQVSPQYRAVYMTRSQSCWLPPEEQAAARADPYLAQRSGTLRIDQLDHRETCSLLPEGWALGTRRTPNGQVFIRTGMARIVLPVQPGQTTAELTLEGYAPPRIANRVSSVVIEPEVDGVSALPITLRVGQRRVLTLPLPATGPDRPRLVTITLRAPQPEALHALNMSDTPQYSGAMLWSIHRR